MNMWFYNFKNGFHSCLTSQVLTVSIKVGKCVGR